MSTALKTSPEPASSTRTRGCCRSCGAKLSTTFIDLGLSPLCESFTPADQLDAGETFYPLHTYVCETCWLVQLNEYVSPEHIFTEYAYFSSFSQSWLDHGERYTVALTTVRRHESTVTVLRRLLARMRELGLKFKRVLVDRAFFNVAVVEFYQAEKLPFVMPVVFRGRRPKKGRKLTGLHAIRRKKAGWYKHVMKNKRRTVEVPVCVGYRTHKNRQDGKRVQRKLLFAAWRVKGSPTKIRELYRKRFGIETSFRQLRQARIYTCTRQPRLRFFFIAVALILRNLWVWIHHALLAEGDRGNRTLHLERLRFKRLLDWIVHEVAALIHDGARPCTVWNN